MDINRANLDALYSNYLTAWQEVLDDDRPADLDMVATAFPSTGASNLYAWLDKVPGFRKWVGDRIYQNVRGRKFEVVNEDFEDSVRLDANDLEDDQYGVYVPIVRMMAQSWLDLKREQVIRVFTENQVTFTGNNLFADNHVYGGNTVDNKTTSSLDADAFVAARLAASAWKYSDNRLVRPRFTHLIVGEANRATAWNIVKNAFAETATSGGTAAIQNPNYGMCELVVWPELVGDYAYYWFLVDSSKPVKPVALQIRKEPDPVMDTDPINVQRNGYVDFLASGRLAAAPTFPHLVYGGLATS